MLEKLINELAWRNVTVTLSTGELEGSGKPTFSAHVATREGVVKGSWPHFQFTVEAMTCNGLAEEISRRMILVEPMVAAIEAHIKHRRAQMDEHRAGEELQKAIYDYCSQPTRHLVEPNMDPKTAKEQPLVVNVDNGQSAPQDPTKLKALLSFDARGIATLIEAGVVAPAEARAAIGLPALAA